MQQFRQSGRINRREVEEIEHETLLQLLEFLLV
jgi:hypothetical protein